MLEFSDFQCPYCRVFFGESLPLVTKDYVDTGRLRFIFANLPLERLHPLAAGAALTAYCAGQQDKFWEMHDWLFENPRSLTVEASAQVANRLGLNQAQLKTCVESQQAISAVRDSEDLALQLTITATPTFLLGVRLDDGKMRVTRRLSGSLPYALLKAAIDEIREP